MKFQVTTDYAFRIILYLGKKGTWANAAEMEPPLGITEGYLLKIARKLRQAGLIESVQGRNGGLRLKKSLGDITVYDVFSIMEGDLIINECLESDGYCSRCAQSSCTVRPFFFEMQEFMKGIMQEKTLDDFADAVSINEINTTRRKA